MYKDKDYLNTLTYLLDINENNNIILQKDVLDAKSFNDSFNNIEKEINSLYEYSRYLEEMISYANVLTNEMFKNINNECESILSEIEVLNDNLTAESNKEYSTIKQLNFKYYPQYLLYDRDKNLLSQAIYKNNLIQSSFKHNEPVRILSKHIDSDSSNKDNIAVVLSDNIINDGVVDNFIYNISPSYVNNISYELNNIKYHTISYVCDDGTSKTINMDNFIGSINENKNIIQFNIETNCLNYTRKKLIVNKDINKNTFWNNLKNKIIETNSINISSLDILDISNTIDYIDEIQKYEKEMQIYNEAHSKYVLELNQWENYSLGEKPEFNLEKPILHSDLEEIEKFVYMYGIVDISFSKNTYEENCCYESNTLDLDYSQTIKVSLESNYYTNQGSSIEFYLKTSSKEYNILPNNENIVHNEKIFFNTSLRFEIDETYTPTIIADGRVLNISVEEAIKTANNYSYMHITYKAKNTNYINILEDNLKLKIIIRYYDKKYKQPFFKDAFIRIFEEDI